MNTLSWIVDPVFTSRLTLALLHFLWQGCCGGLLVIVCGTLFREAPARFRYVLSVAVLILMALCLPVTFLIVDIPVAAANKTAALPNVLEPRAADSTLDELPTPSAARIVSPASKLVESREPPAGSSATPEAGPAPAEVHASLESWETLLTANTFQSLSRWVATLYLFGVVLILARLLRGVWGGRRLRKLANVIDDALLLEMVGKLARRLGLKVVPTVAWCGQISVPVVVGIVKPMILLPLAVVSGLTPHQLQALVLHELAHIRRFDPIVNLLQRIIEALLFFHPMVWFVSRRISVVREHAADDTLTAAASGYSIPDRRQIVQQLRIALTEFYVHLERKRLQYGFDAVRALELLEPSLDTLTDGEFHQSIVQLIARTRDRHLVFSGRDPLGATAVLPFTIERFFDGQDEKFAVTKIAAGFTPQDLRVGAIVTHWNGIRIDRFVRLNANVFDGSHDAAAMARSLVFLTSRSLRRFAPPLEDWVDLDFEIDGTSHRERFTWSGITTDIPVTPSIGRNVIGFGGDFELLVAQQIRRVQFAPASFDELPAAAAGQLGVPEILGRHFVVRSTVELDVFHYGRVTTTDGTFGYVRLFNFQADNVDDIANALIQAFASIPGCGVILDLRGNSGGYIAAGERLLQLLTNRRITPTRFQFRVTTATRAMVEVTDSFLPWRQSMREAAPTGEPFSQGYPIEGVDDDFNAIGQKYFGPVVIITDALAFSTADMFVAGFIDHDIGRVVCIDKNMAAAGGNNWNPWDVVRLYNPDFTLPPELQQTLEAGTLSPAVFQAFNRAGTSLSDQAQLSTKTSEYDGNAWRVQDGTLRHVIRFLPWANNGLYVYLHVGRGGMADMPDGVTFGLTMRRCVRVRKSEGRLLEDLGIQPDVVYRLTKRDLLDRNRDLITRAAAELV